MRLPLQVLFSNTSAGFYVTGATPVVQYGGRLWRAIEIYTPPQKYAVARYGSHIALLKYCPCRTPMRQGDRKPSDG